MTAAGVDAIRAQRDDVLAVARSLTAEEWATRSDCAGWTVHDVVAHMACVYRSVAEPGSVPISGSGDVEVDAELPVAERKGWPDADVLAEYEEWSEKGLEALAGLQHPPMADTVIPLQNLGSHPLHLLADALAFDHYCHLRIDILRPLGPVDRPRSPADDLRLRPVMSWMFAGIPQMNSETLTPIVTDPVRFSFSGAGAGVWTLLPADGDKSLRVRESSVDVAATVHSTAHEFVVWGSQRRPWRERDVRIEGDEDYAAPILDAINVI